MYVDSRVFDRIRRCPVYTGLAREFNDNRQAAEHTEANRQQAEKQARKGNASFINDKGGGSASCDKLVQIKIALICCRMTY